MTKLQEKEARVRAELPDPVALIQQAISADLDSSVFNEQQFPEAPNVIEWCRGTEWLNSSVDLFPKQIEVLARFFEDVCYQCSDVDYVHAVPVDDTVGNVLDRFVLLNRGICPQCGRNRTEMLDEWIKDSRYGKFHSWDAAVKLRPVPPNEFTGIWGQRSGKSITVAAFLWPYVLHRILAKPNLSRYLGVPGDVVLEAAFVSPTLRQINQHIWMPFTNSYNNSPWFKNVVSYLKDEGRRTGVQLYHQQQTFIIFPGKRLAVHILAGNSSTLRGGTRVFCLPGNVLVNTTDGLVPLAQKQTISNSAVHVSGKVHAVAAHTEVGIKNISRVSLKHGYTLEATPEHRVKTLSNDLVPKWTRVSELSEGDYVAVGLGATFPEKLELNYAPVVCKNRMLLAYEYMAEAKEFTAEDIVTRFGLKGVYTLTHDLIKSGALRKTYLTGKKNAGCRYNITASFDLNKLTNSIVNHKHKDRLLATFPREMSSDLGYLLGYYVSEGSYSGKVCNFSFSNTDIRVIDHFVTCFERVFGITPKVITRLKPVGSRHKTAYVVGVGYAVIKNFFRYLGLTPSTSGNKVVPWSILQAPKHAVLAFISAYIEGDGSISEKAISMVSCSKKLLQQIQLLFLNLGVLASVVVSREARGVHNTLYILRLRRYDAIQVVAQLTCCTKGKNFNYTLGRLRSEDYRVPFLRSYITSQKQGGHGEKWVYVSSHLNTVRDGCKNYALRNLKKENASLYEKALRLIDIGIVWLPVEKLENIGEDIVYDLAVDNPEHAFVGNGIVVHNSALDELGWFNVTEDGKTRGSAKEGTEVFTSLNNSLRTVRSKVEKRRKMGDFDAIDGYMVNISSPSSIADPIEQRAAEAPKAFRMFFTRYKTWEVNKDEDETLIREEFAGNPLKFTRDFCAQPPRASHPYFENDAILKDIVAKNHTSLFSYEIKTEEVMGNRVLRPVVSKHLNDTVIPRIMTVDTGEKKNSFCLCIARYYPEQDGVLFEEFVEVSPWPDVPIDLAWCYNEFIVPLVKLYKFQHVVYDRWESGYAVADLRSNHNIDAQRYSSVWSDFDDFRDGLLGTRIWLPPPECEPMDLLKMPTFQERAKYPRAHFQAQLLTVNEFGKRLEKPEAGNDDLFRVAVLAYRFITKYKKLYQHNVVEGPKFDQDRPVAMFFGRSGRQMSNPIVSRGHRGGNNASRSIRPRAF
jgi:intein/homing endonuclease